MRIVLCNISLYAFQDAACFVTQRISRKPSQSHPLLYIYYWILQEYRTQILAIIRIIWRVIKVFLKAISPLINWDAGIKNCWVFFKGECIQWTFGKIAQCLFFAALLCKNPNPLVICSGMPDSRPTAVHRNLASWCHKLWFSCILKNCLENNINWIHIAICIKLGIFWKQQFEFLFVRH